MTKRVLAAVLILAAALSVAACKGASPVKRTRAFFCMDTAVMLTVYTRDPQLLADAEAECARLENLLSRTREGSDVWNINHAGGKPVNVAEETASVLQTALWVSRLSIGAFDITVAPALELWNFKDASAPLPDEATLRDACEMIDYRKITLSGSEVTLPEGMKIDLGGIAKGYVTDRIAALLSGRGVTNALLNFGGNLYLMGQNPETGRAWRVGVQDPAGEAGAYLCETELSDLSSVTSGIYIRGFEREGTWYHHILDPSTGRPADNDLASATVIAQSSALADALSTAVMCLGAEKGQRLIEDMKGARAILITRAGEIIQAGGAETPAAQSGGQQP